MLSKVFEGSSLAFGDAIIGQAAWFLKAERSMDPQEELRGEPNGESHQIRRKERVRLQPAAAQDWNARPMMIQCCRSTYTHTHNASKPQRMNAREHVEQPASPTSSSIASDSASSSISNGPQTQSQKQTSILVTVGSTSFPRLIRYILSSRFTRHLPRNTTLHVQYGSSNLSDILSEEEADGSVGFASIDPTSALHPSPGLRNDPKHGYTWKGAHHRQSEALDPGLMGDLIGWNVDVDVGGPSAPTQEPSPSPSSSFISNPKTLTFKLGGVSNVTLHLFDFTSTDELARYMSECDVVISHAGSGSLLECLRGRDGRGTQRKRRMILVPNTTLLDNHQVELAQAIDEGKWAWMATVDGTGGEPLERVLSRVLNGEDGDDRPVPFPPSQPQRFRDIVDGLLSS